MCQFSPPGRAKLLLQGIPPAERNNAQDQWGVCVCMCVCMDVCVCVRVLYSAASLMVTEEDGQVAQVCLCV